jgi:hypothetical protein
MYLFLILVGVLVIAYGLKSDKKDKPRFEELLQKKENDVNDFDIAVGELRMEFSSTILELQKEIMELSQKVDMLNKIEQYGSSSVVIEKTEIPEIEEKAPRKRKMKTAPAASKEEAEVNINIEQEKTMESPETIPQSGNGSRIEEIRQLFDRGIPIDEICEKVQMGRGEILLIKELYLK